MVSFVRLIVRRVLLLTPCLALLLMSYAATAQHNTQVHNYRLPEKIVDLNPIGENSLPFPADGRRSLYVWLELVGTKQTLAYLEKHESLSLRAIWRVGLRNTERMEIGITPIRWNEEAAKIRDQVRREGSFRWRTFCKKSYFEADEYQLFVVDANGKRIRDLQTNKAFEMQLNIRRQ